MSERLLVGDCVCQTLQEHPKATSCALARMLVAKWPAIFLTVEQARNAVRRYRGAHGNRNRKKTKAQYKRTPQEIKHCIRWGAIIPEPIPNPWKWHDLPSGPKRWLILADLHIPHHDKKCLEIALRFAEKETDGVLLLGDAMDCHSLSPWLRDPRERNFPEELDAMSKFLDVLKQLCPQRVVYKAGNHELRLERYLWQRAPELFGLKSFQFKHFLQLEQRGIDWIDAMDPIHVGKLALLHGHEIARGNAVLVNPARSAYLRGKSCIIVGHWHRTSEHTEVSIDDVTTTCWSIGACCGLHPAYDPVANRWNHGFAVLDLTKESWTVENYRIVDGHVR